MNSSLNWFKRFVWLGIIINMFFALPALFAPDQLLASMGFIGDSTTEWLQNAGMLVLTVSLFYIPAAISPVRFAAYAWIVVGARYIAAVFWVYVVTTSSHSAAFIPMLITDSSFGIILGILLFLGLPKEDRISWQKIKQVVMMPIDYLAAKWKSNLFKTVTIIIIVLVVFVGYTLWTNTMRAMPDTVFESEEEQFKYGAIGLSMESRVPYYIFKILPEMFPEKLPGPGGWESLGLLFEDGKDIPVGFSRRQIGFPSVEPNCALCHTGSYKMTPSGKKKIVLAAPAHELDLEAFQWFLYDSASDPKFNADEVMAQIEKIADLSWTESLIYRYILIPFTKHSLQKQKIAYAWQKRRPLQGKGRTDTFNPTKFNVFHFPVDNTIGTVDLPQIWNQRKREGMWLHWDGNNNEIRERNYAAAMAIGATPESVIPANFNRVTDFLLDLKPAKFPAEIDKQKAGLGKVIYDRECASCHQFGAEMVGTVTPLEEIGTDAHRLFSFTVQTVDRFHQFKKPPFVFNAYRKTYGYSSPPLDGIWARGPYLHNGSVPNLWELLQKPENRTKVFYKGYNLYDPVNVGFVHSGAEAEKIGFKLDTSMKGNGSRGHLYGTDLSDSEKWNLIEYLKTQ